MKKKARFKKLQERNSGVTRQTILILDFGSQYTQLIARRVRENKVFSIIIPYNTPAKEIALLNPKGIILSGGPASVVDKKSPYPDIGIFKLGVPILGICYGMQVICELLGGKVRHTREREYGKVELFIDDNRDLFSHLPGNFTCWASHGDYVTKMPAGFHTIGHTTNTPIAAISNQKRKIFAVQFHPEVTHTEKGSQILSNFLFKACGAIGVVTNGPSRDVDEIRPMKFQYMMSGVTPGHGEMAISAVNVPVSVAGMDVAPGEIIHMDENGACKFPADRLADVCKNVDAFKKEEDEQVKAINSAKTLEEIKAAFSGKKIK